MQDEKKADSQRGKKEKENLYLCIYIDKTEKTTTNSFQLFLPLTVMNHPAANQRVYQTGFSFLTLSVALFTKEQVSSEQRQSKKLVVYGLPKVLRFTKI